jgi:hypothetical protein
MGDRLTTHRLSVCDRQSVRTVGGGAGEEFLSRSRHKRRRLPIYCVGTKSPNGHSGMEPCFCIRTRDGKLSRFQRFDDQPLVMPLLLPLAGLAQELIRLQIGQTVTLMQSGVIADKGSLPEIVSSNERVVRVSHVVSIGSTAQQFQVTALVAGSAWLLGKSDSPVVPPLRVCVGNFKNHSGLETDLIESVCRGSDVPKIFELQRLLDNNSNNLFNENSDANIAHWGELACGTVAKVGGIELFLHEDELFLP